MKMKKRLLGVLASGTVAFSMIMGGGAAISSNVNLFPTAIVAYADDDTAASAYAELSEKVATGAMPTGGDTNLAGTQYICEGGGTLKYSDIWNQDTFLLNEGQLNKLKGKEKEKFLTDSLKCCDAWLAVGSGDKKETNSTITDQTKTAWLNTVQQTNGVGTQLMTTLLQNTKPDYVTANRIYEPFSGVVGTILGLMSIILMAALGLTMALDLSYIGIPAVRLFMGGEDGNSAGRGKGGSGKGWGKLISYEAVTAVKEAEGGDSSKDGGGKVAVGIYFKKRVIMLIVLGVCLLYLIQGQIYTLVAWILDLLKGFVGF